MSPPDLSSPDLFIKAKALSDERQERQRILIVTADVLSEQMAGPAIRAWQIANALADDHEVQLVTLGSVCTLPSDRFSIRAVSANDLVELEEWCSVMVVQGFVLHGAPLLQHSKKIMIVDVYDPLHFETLELTRGEDDEIRHNQLRFTVWVLNEQLNRGDYFLCASEKQRNLWLGQLGALSRLNPFVYDEDPTLRQLISVVPFGLPDDPPVKTASSMRGVIEGIGVDDEIVLWGGGIYDWFDPLTLIRAIGLVHGRRPSVRLVFMGMVHPNPEVKEMRMSAAARALADQLGLTGKAVFFHESWVPYDTRQNFLLEADLGVSTHLDHAETAFSFRTRMLDYLWTGLPIVATRGDGFADLIEAEGLGLVVAPGDVDALADAIETLLSDTALAAQCRANLAEVAPRFAWSAALGPLIDFCRHPRHAADRRPAQQDESPSVLAVPEKPKNDLADTGRTPARRGRP